MAGRYVVIGCLALNVLLSILIVLINKWIYTHYGFPNVTMTCLHFVSTTICVSLCYKLNVFHRKSLPIFDMLPLSLTFCGFVVFTNLSLQTNTVGTYQLFKMLTTPVIVLIQTYYYGRNFSTPVKLSLIPMMLGVLLNTYADVEFNLLGITFATIGVAVTSLYQVWVGEKQRSLQANSMQMLYYQAPLSATFLMPIIPVVEPLFSEHGIFSVWSYEAMAMVVLSSLIAFGVNLSIFSIIGNTSALTYNVIGHTKFCLTLLGGVMLFNEHLTYLQIFSICLVFIGVVVYIRVKRNEVKAVPRHWRLDQLSTSIAPVKELFL